MQANSVVPDQMPQLAASELDPHCLHNNPDLKGLIPRKVGC